MKQIIGTLVLSTAIGVLGCGGGASGDDLTSSADQTLAQDGPTTTTRVSCASQLFQRRECGVDTQGGHIVDARITQDMSNPPFLCRQGDSNGFTPNSVWVNHGCSAEFEVTIQLPAPVEEREQIRCVSDGHYVLCNSSLTDIHRGRLIRQESGARCQEGDSYGFYQDAVWVDRGCRGVFEVFGRPGGQTSNGIDLYDQRGAQGNRYGITAAIDNLANTGFNDRTQSIVVRGGNWEVCSDAGFNGFCSTFGPGEYDDLGPLAGAVSSVRPR
jgi:hypothetical protein